MSVDGNVSHSGDKLSDELDPSAFSGRHQVLLQKEMGLHYRSGPAMEASGEHSLSTAPDHRGLIPCVDAPPASCLQVQLLPREAGKPPSLSCVLPQGLCLLKLL